MAGKKKNVSLRKSDKNPSGGLSESGRRRINRETGSNLKRPQPAAFEYFSFVVPIWPKAYREKVGAEGYSKAPVGAGPYRFTKVDAATLEVTRVRFDEITDRPDGVVHRHVREARAGALKCAFDDWRSSFTETPDERLVRVDR